MAFLSELFTCGTGNFFFPLSPTPNLLHFHSSPHWGQPPEQWGQAGWRLHSQQEWHQPEMTLMKLSTKSEWPIITIMYICSYLQITTRSIQPWCSSRTPSVAASAARGQAGPGVHCGHVAILIPHDHCRHCHHHSFHKFLQSVKIRSCTWVVADTEEGETATTRSSMVACFFQNISCILISLRKTL